MPSIKLEQAYDELLEQETIEEEVAWLYEDSLEDPAPAPEPAAPKLMTISELLRVKGAREPGRIWSR